MAPPPRTHRTRCGAMIGSPRYTGGQRPLLDRPAVQERRYALIWPPVPHPRRQLAQGAQPERYVRPRSVVPIASPLHSTRHS